MSPLLPVVLSEQIISRFTFYLLNTIHQGMRYQGELYGLAAEFNAHSRLQAYKTACELTANDVPLVITASLNGYKLWVNLKAPDVLSWLTANLSSQQPDQFRETSDNRVDMVGMTKLAC